MLKNVEHELNKPPLEKKDTIDNSDWKVPQRTKQQRYRERLIATKAVLEGIKEDPELSQFTFFWMLRRKKISRNISDVEIN